MTPNKNPDQGREEGATHATRPGEDHHPSHGERENERVEVT